MGLFYSLISRQALFIKLQMKCLYRTVLNFSFVGGDNMSSSGKEGKQLCEIQFCGCLEPTGFLGGWMACSIFVFKCIPFLSRWSASGVAGECACLYLCALTCLWCHPSIRLENSPVPACSRATLACHLWRGNSHGLFDFSAQNSVLHSLAWPLNCS